MPTRRFSHVHINIVGPLPSSQEYSYLLTLINRTSLLASISTESCVNPVLSLPLNLGFEVWGSSRPCLQQGSPVYFLCLVWSLCFPGNLGLYYNLLPSLKQWDDQAVPLFSQIRSRCLFSYLKLVSTRQFMDLLSSFLESSSGVRTCLC